MLRIAILIGSTRPNRRAPVVADWVRRTVQTGDGVDVDVLDLADFDLPLLDEPVPPAMAQEYEHGHTRRWAKAVASFDGFVVVTPEYNHSIPGALKNAIDFLNQEWADKAVGFVSYGSAGGVRAVEHLRQVAGELRMADVRAQVMLSLFDDFDGDGRFAPRPHHRDALSEMFSQLLGWSTALAVLRSGSRNLTMDHILT
jgi:NAD(P)H-dependent FMN reductase